MQVFVIGAGGGVARRLLPRLVARGDVVTGMHRNPDHAEVVSATGATSLLADLIVDDVERLAELMAGHDAVVFSAGAHGTGMEFTALIDGKGLSKSLEAARRAGVGRFVLVSAFPEAGRGGPPHERFEHYLRVKKAADVELAASDLDWVIVRPGTLTDAPGDGRVNAGVAIDYGEVSRDDVAGFIAEVLHRPALNRTIVELTGGSTPIDQAVEAVVASTGPRVAPPGS